MRTPSLARPPAALAAIEFLGRHEVAATLLPTAERLARLTKDLLARVPAPLRGAVELSAPGDATVVLNVASASTAAKLRQSLPSLRDGLVACGWKIDVLRVRVRPRSIEREAALPPKRAAMPPGAVAAFERLGRALDESPLRTAVEHLVRRRGDAGPHR